MTLPSSIIWWITLCLWFLPRMVLSSLVVHSEWLTVSTQSHSSAKLVLSLSDISDHNVWSWSEHRRKTQCLTHTSILRVTNPQQTEIVVLYYWGTGSSSVTVFLLLCLPEASEKHPRSKRGDIYAFSEDCPQTLQHPNLAYQIQKTCLMQQI